MSEKLVTPVDKLTRLPLPLLPRRVLSRDDPEQANDHHAFHPSDSPTLDMDTLAGAALRTCLSYLVDVKEHNAAVKGTDKPGYHDWYEGPKLPTTDQEIFEIAVFAHAGARPRKAIDLSGDQPKVVIMNDHEWNIFSMPAIPPTPSPSRMLRLSNSADRAYDELISPDIRRQTYIDGRVTSFLDSLAKGIKYRYQHVSQGYIETRDFISDFLPKQDLSHVNPLKIEEFLDTKDDDRRRFLGFCFIGQAIQVATEAMEQRYSQIQKEGRLHPLKPVHARHQAAVLLGGISNWDAVVGSIENNLINKLEIAA